jgi:hypothetical protein
VMSLAIAFIAIVCVWAYMFVALVCNESCDCLGEGLDLHQHCVELGVLKLVVGCMVIVGRRCTCYLGNVVTDFIAPVCKLVHRLVLVSACGTAACILLVCVGCFHQLLGKLEVSLGGGCLSLSIEHFVVVKMIAVVHFHQVKLDFGFVHNRYIEADKRVLVVVEALPKGGEMFVTIPLGVVHVF